MTRLLGERRAAGSATLLEQAAAALRAHEEDGPEPTNVLAALQNRIQGETGPLAELAEPARSARYAHDAARRAKYP